MSRARLKDEPFWCKAAPGRSELPLFNWRIARERESSPLTAPKATSKSHREQAQTRSWNDTRIGHPDAKRILHEVLRDSFSESGR